jgi:hypothetical protein
MSPNRFGAMLAVSICQVDGMERWREGATPGWALFTVPISVIAV